MKSGLGERALRLIATAVVTTPFLCEAALAETTVGIGVSGRVEYATNPFLLAATNTDALRGILTVSPSIETKTPRSTLLISGDVSYSDYSRIYRSSFDYGVKADYRNALTSRLNLNATAAYDSSVSRSYEPNPLIVGGLPSVLPEVPDITLVGLQDRRDVFRGGFGLSYVPDAKNRISLNYDGTYVRIPNNAPVNGVTTGDYLTYGQTFGYSRTVNARLSLGASVRVSRFDYQQTNVGDSRVISPNITADVRLSANWTLSGGVGVTFLRQVTAFGTQNTRDLSLNLSACREDTRSGFCLNGSHSVSPSSLGAARRTTEIGATYNYRLNSRDELTFGGNYMRSQETVAGPIASVEYLSGLMGYRRKLNERFGLSVDGSFTRSTYAGTRSDARISVGINYNWNNRR